MPRLGSVNNHPAFLPRHRGPYPLAWTFREGDTEFGATWHRMDAEFDTGPILAQSKVPLEDTDCWIEDYAPKILQNSFSMLPRVFERLEAGDPGDPQSAEGVSWAGPFEEEYATRRLVADGARDPQPGARLAPSVRGRRHRRADRGARRRATEASAHEPHRPGRRRAPRRVRRRTDLGRRVGARRGRLGPGKAVPVRGPPPLEQVETRVRLPPVGRLRLHARAVARRELRHRIEHLPCPSSGAGHQDHARPVPDAHEDVLGPGRTVEEVPRPRGAAPHPRRAACTRRTARGNPPAPSRRGRGRSACPAPGRE